MNTQLPATTDGPRSTETPADFAVPRPWTAARSIHITGWGGVVPEGVLTNEDLSHLVDTSDEWIRSRTGIAHRRHASVDDRTEDLAAAAGRLALARAGRSPLDIDLVICTSNTFTSLVPNTSCAVQRALGADRAAAFDVQSACTGFIHALAVASALLREGPYRSALVVAAEIMTRVVDWRDRDSCVLFGDGAGAVVLERSAMPGGIKTCTLGSDGRLGDLIQLPIGVAAEGFPGHPRANVPVVCLQGREVFRFASRVVVDFAEALAASAGLPVAAIDLIVPHQANGRILSAAAKQLGLPPDRLYDCISEFGNTSSASVPLALDHALRAGRIQPGDLVALSGFGGGLSWGGVLVEWTAECAVNGTQDLAAGRPQSGSSNPFNKDER